MQAFRRKLLLATGALPLSNYAQDKDARLQVLESVRERFKLPAIGAAIIKDNELVWHHATGFLKMREASQVTPSDLWHLGSCGKAMTATAIALLVERGLLTYTTALGEIFPDIAKSSLARTSLLDLLCHRSGLPANPDLAKFAKFTDASMARSEVLASSASLTTAPGKFLYSNWGYILLGAVIEKLTKQSFESYMNLELFSALGMKSAGFGGTSANGELDQPWPHTAKGEPYAVNGRAIDNPAVMSPAGRMHMSLTDWAKFITLHLQGARLKPGTKDKFGLLSAETYAQCHQERGDNYALGWLVPERGWAGGRVLHHAGDNTLNFAVVWAAPQKGLAVLVTINQSGTGAAADTAVGDLLKTVL